MNKESCHSKVNVFMVLNIIDLIKDAIRQRKDVEPRGWKTFSKALHESNIPQEVIGNSSRWKWMQKTHDASEGEESDRLFYTPKSVRKSVRKSMKKIKEKTPYMRPEEREKMKQFYVKELLTPTTPPTIKKTPSRKILQS